MSEAHKDLTNLYDEIAAVIYATAAQDSEFREHVWWFSVGLINDSMEIHWRSYVNYRGNHSTLWCQPRSGRAKCLEIKNQTDVPPCPTTIEETCTFRTHLDKLEKATMEECAHSLGRISLLSWIHKGDTHYISSHNSGLTWMTIKEAVVSQSGIKEHAGDEANSTYKNLAAFCMTPDPEKGMTCSVALSPLILHRFSGDLGYYGAVVVCGTEKSEIWNRFSLLKSLVTPLLESKRGLRGIPSTNGKEKPHDLLMDTLLYDLNPDKNLFQGKCDDTTCKLHSGSIGDDSRSRHNIECRVIRQNGVIGANLFTSENFRLAKALFNLGNICEKDRQMVIYSSEALKRLPQSSHLFTVNEMVKFFNEAFNLNIVTEVNGDQKVSWPIKPGLFSAIAIAELYVKLKEEAASQLLPTVTLKILNQMVQFVFSLEPGTGSVLADRLANTGNIQPGVVAVIVGKLTSGLPTRDIRPPTLESINIVNALNAPVSDGHIRWDVNADNLIISWPLVIKKVAKKRVST